MEQNKTADKMGVSRKTFWIDLQKARQKVADALVNGKAIEISGGEYVNTGECRVNFLCKECDHLWEPELDQLRPTSCPNCGSNLTLE
jgi:rubrerythrin